MDINDYVNLFQKTGDSEAYSIIMDQSYRIADSIIFQKYNNFGYYDDLTTVAHDAIIKCINSFDSNKGKFTTYCYKVIDRDIVWWIKKHNKESSLYVDGYSASGIQDGPLLIDIREAFNSLSKFHQKSLIGNGGSRWSNQRAINKFAQKLGYA